MNKGKVIYTMAAVALATCLSGCKATELESKTTSDTLKEEVNTVEVSEVETNESVVGTRNEQQEAEESVEEQKPVVEQKQEVKEEVEEVVEIKEEIKKEVKDVKTPHFNPNNLLEKSNLTRDDAYRMLKGSRLQSVSSHYIYAEETYGVNAIFLMGLTSLESGHGTSNIAINNNNIGGVRKGSGEYSSFSSWESCISYIANLISKYYLKDGATYFSGHSIWDVNENYCENSDWADKIVSIGKGLMSNL